MPAMVAYAPREIPRMARFRVEHFHIFDSFLLMFYTALVYAWGLTVHPMGRDYAAMATNGESLPFLARSIFAWEVQTFGASPLPYHLVNIVAFYGCVWCVMHLTNFTVRGLWWLGTWAGAVFMANPVHTESILNLSGIGDSIPAFFALLAITAYAYHAYKPRNWTYGFALVTFAFAITPYPLHAFLFIIIVMFEILITRPENRHFPRLMPYLLMGIGAVLYHFPELKQLAVDPGAWFGPLYFTFYPIGFLPENAAAMHHQPWLGWVAAFAVFAILMLIYRKARRPAILFAGLAMIVVRLFPSARSIDPVHLVGGGELIVASGFFTVAFAAVAYRCMDHPKWKVPIVGMTTAFAIAAALVQIRAELNWRAAGAAVKTFQASAIAASDRDNGEPIGVLPDWRYFRGAPMQLSESIRYETPFSRALSPQSIIELDAKSLLNDAVTLESWDESGGVLRINDARPIDVFPWFYPRIQAVAGGEVVSTESADDTGLTITISGKGYPTTVIPATRSLGEETGGEAETGTGDEEPAE